MLRLVYFKAMLIASEHINQQVAGVRGNGWRADVRVLIVLYIAYAVALFLVSSWLGMLLAALAFALVFAVSRVSVRRVFALAAPVYLLVGFMLLGGSFVIAQPDALGLVQVAGVLSFSTSGFARSCLFGVRVLLLVWMSLTIGFSLTATEVSDAVVSFLNPLRRLGLNIDDISAMISVAIRFVPLMAEEFQRVRKAQWSRGGLSASGGVVARVKEWAAVLAPVVAGLFRRSDALGEAMEARCYGAAERRTSLHDTRMSAKSWLVLGAGLLFCVLLAALF